MVALKTYKPLEFGVNPFAVAQQLASPYDYNGTLKALQDWNNLSNNELLREANELKLDAAQQEADFSNKRKEKIQEQIDAGTDPNKIDLAGIEKQIGNYEGYIKASDLQDKERKAKETERRQLIKDISSINKTQPELAQQMFSEAGIPGILQAPKQKAGDGDKPKTAKPEVWVNLISQETQTVDANSVADTNEAKAKGFVPADQFTDARPYLKRQAKTEASDDDSSPGMLERFFNSGTPTPKASPMPTPPPGHLLVRDKKTGEVKIIKK